MFQRCFQSLSFHNICIGSTMIKRVDSLANSFLVCINQHVQIIFFGNVVPEFDHFAEFPGCINMKKGKGKIFRIKRLSGEMEHDRAVLRSEERRVGKECRSGSGRDKSKKKEGDE